MSGAQLLNIEDNNSNHNYSKTPYILKSGAQNFK